MSCKVQLTLYPATKAKWGCRYKILYFNLDTLFAGGWSTPRPGLLLSPGKNRYPLYRSLRGFQCRVGQCGKSRPYRISIPRPSTRSCQHWIDMSCQIGVPVALTPSKKRYVTIEKGVWNGTRERLVALNKNKNLLPLSRIINVNIFVKLS